MIEFSERSSKLLEPVDEGLVWVAKKTLQVIDITVITGHRDEEEQTRQFNKKQSKVQWPNSKHNSLPSMAIDIAPWPIPVDWGSSGPDRLYTDAEMKERAKFYHMAGVFLGFAYEEGVPVRWGGDWDGDQQFNDQSFDDLVHFERKI